MLVGEWGNVSYEKFNVTDWIKRAKKKEQSIEASKKSLESSISNNASFSNIWNGKMRNKLIESQQKTKELNDIYKSLKEEYDKWELLKKNITTLGKYSGLLRSSICNNFKSNKSQICFSY